MAIKCPNCGYDNEDPGDGGPLSCNLCQFVLRRESRKHGEDEAALLYARMAENAVARAPQDMLLASYGVELDYSAASVRGWDAAMEAMYGKEGEAPDSADYRLPEARKAVVLHYGAYLGETLRRLTGAAWRKDPAAPADPARGLVAGAGWQVCPFQRIVSRFKNGSRDAFMPLLQEAAARNPAIQRAWGRDFLRHAGRIAGRGALPWAERKALAVEFCMTAGLCDPALKKEAAELAEKFLRAPDPDQPQAAPAQQQAPQQQEAPQPQPRPPGQDFGRRFEGFARFTVLHAQEDPIIAGFGIDLDYGPGSLFALDLAIDAAIGPDGQAPQADMETYKLSKDQLGHQLGIGSYYGEVCRRALGGVWQPNPQWHEGLGSDAAFILSRISFPEGNIYPVMRTIQRFKDGTRYCLFHEFQQAAIKIKASGRHWAAGFIKQAGLIIERGTQPIAKRAPAVGLLCKLGLTYDPELAGEVMLITQKLSRIPPQ